MYILDLTQKIRNFRDNTEPMSSEIYDFLDHIIDDIEVIGKEAIHWTVGDFLFQALGAENVQIKDPNIELCDITMGEAYKYLNKYDHSKFQYALERMIDKHDTSIGITWDTLDFYLDEYCLI